MPYQLIPLEKFAQLASSSTEISSVALGGKVLSVSDEFFAEAFHLLLVEPAPSLKGQFGPKGALFSGWESRRHNPTYDWVIIKLGTPGLIIGFDIDTSHFNGNEAPQASVQALLTPIDEDLAPDDERWVEILPKVNLGPSARHLFTIPQTTTAYSHVKLNMYPDGGIARFRVYGLVSPIFPQDVSEVIDLASVYSGGRTVVVSDQHFGVGSNLLLPGRGKDMGDGWETKRSRAPGHKDWAIVKLGEPGYLESVDIDTSHFMGNFPASAELHALQSSEDIPTAAEGEWVSILPRTKMGPHSHHKLPLTNVEDKVYTHVRMTIHPDGGVKRLRVYGRRAVGSTSAPVKLPNGTTPVESMEKLPSILAQPLTPEAFAPFGKVLQGFASEENAPPKTLVTKANQGTALKFHALSPVESSYPEGSNARTLYSVYRANPVGAKLGEEFDVKLLERHPCTNQGFIAMGPGTGSGPNALTKAARAYLVVVAKNGADDKPDVDSVQAFLATTAQGVVYNTGVWHHPLISLETTIDFACVETQIGQGNPLDCEIVELGRIPRVQVPEL